MSRTAATLIAVVGVLAAPSAQAGPKITAKAAVVMDADTGKVLWQRRGDTAYPPASTTKVLTAIVALESGRLQEGFGVSKRAAATPASKIYLRPGQRMELDDLLYAILLKSANDAALVIAEGLGGSQSGFAKQMNRKARQIGATNSSFKNPHGLTAKGHVASAHDIATIFRYGLGIPRFRRILETTSIRVPIYSSKVRRVTLRSKNRLLSGYRYKVIGKTGYTRAAGRCFVAAARDGKREVIIAFLGSSNLWGDARSMIGWAFEHTETPKATQVASTRPHTPETPKVSPLAIPVAAREPAPAWVTARRIDESGGRSKAARFTVRFGPYDDDRTLARTRQDLAKSGYTPLEAGRALRLGEFASRGRAMHLAQRLRQSGYRPDVVALY